MPLSSDGSAPNAVCTHTMYPPECGRATESSVTTIVIGQDVRISQVAVSHGTLTVTITETPEIVQPNPFSEGVTAVQPSTLVTATQPDSVVAIVNGASLQAIASGLNQMGVKPTDTIAILQAIKSAGALQAELVLQ